MATDVRGPLITARSFFRQLRAYGYDSNQILHVIVELLALLVRSICDTRQCIRPAKNVLRAVASASGAADAAVRDKAAG